MTKQQITDDASRAFKIIQNGGIGILPMDIGYSLIGGSADALIRIFETKGRANDKLNAFVGDLTLADELFNLTPQSRKLFHLHIFPMQGQNFPSPILKPKYWILQTCYRPWCMF